MRKLVEATQPGTVERVAVMFPAFTGIRVGELTGATWEAIDLKAGRFEVKLNLQDNDKGCNGNSASRRPQRFKRDAKGLCSFYPAENDHDGRFWREHTRGAMIEKYLQHVSMLLVFLHCYQVADSAKVLILLSPES